MNRWLRHLVLVDDALWILAAPSGESIYDFAVEAIMPCRHPQTLPDRLEAVARIGAIQDVDALAAELDEVGIALVNTPEQHSLVTELPRWYPALADLSPRSIWFEGAPDPEVIAATLGWPVFMKGSRQTSGHRRHLSVIEGPDALAVALREYATDPVLRWQKIVCREFVRLRPVEGNDRAGRIPASFEFRAFWWRGELVGVGRYWWDGCPYEAAPAEREAAIAVAGEAVRRLGVPFVVVDVAQTVEGRWIVVEVNDAQESGYAGVSPFAMWQRIVEVERARAQGRGL